MLRLTHFGQNSGGRLISVMVLPTFLGDLPEVVSWAG
jgi:hypothetical protein